DHLGCDMMCFFFQAEDGIRDGHVTGVQTCALPICPSQTLRSVSGRRGALCVMPATTAARMIGPRSLIGLIALRYVGATGFTECRSEERRVGKECRCRGWADS